MLHDSNLQQVTSRNTKSLCSALASVDIEVLLGRSLLIPLPLWLRASGQQ
jgi:hypothetical protein